MHTQRSPRVLTPFLALGLLLAVAPPAWGQRGMNYLVQVQGEVYIRRALASQRASSGTLVGTDQTLEVRPNGQVTLMCSNHTQRVLRSGTHQVRDYCPAASGVRSQTTRGETGRNGTRRVFDGAQPYVISPRNTALLSPDGLLIEWHPTGNSMATIQTQVTLEGEAVDWTIVTPLRAVPYGGSQALVPDFTYTITVERRGKTSKADFVVLSPQERDRVGGEVAKIQALDLDPDEEAIGIALAYLNYENPDPDYRSHALNWDALRVLQARIQAGTRHSQIYWLQGETYLAMDLPLEARQSFERSVALAEANNDQQTLAQSYRRLGEIADRQEEQEAARGFFQKALNLYQAWGDGEQVQDIQKVLERLEGSSN